MEDYIVKLFEELRQLRAEVEHLRHTVQSQAGFVHTIPAPPHILSTT